MLKSCLWGRKYLTYLYCSSVDAYHYGVLFPTLQMGLSRQSLPLLPTDLFPLLECCELQEEKLFAVLQLGKHSWELEWWWQALRQWQVIFLDLLVLQNLLSLQEDPNHDARRLAESKVKEKVSGINPRKRKNCSTASKMSLQAIILVQYTAFAHILWL